MESEWLEIAYINFEEAILHGRVCDGRDSFGVNREREVRVTLTEDQKRQVEDLNEDHRRDMRRLLKGFAPHPRPA